MEKRNASSLATELQRRSTGRTIYVLDEPTTGLHFEDVNKLLGVLKRLVESGNTVIVIEHNLDVIKSSDWVIDMGPEGGFRGGTVVAEGTPEEVAKVKASYTGQYLAEILATNRKVNRKEEVAMAEPSSYRPKEIPEEPGVYRFYNGSDKVIYVGKAKNLKNRLTTYFGSNLAQKTYRMVHEAVRVDWTIVGTELEALALEFSWIKQYHPTYNVQFKDDKSYPYLAISMADEFPRIFITRKEKRPGLKYFGPYTNAWALRNTYEVLLKVFPVRSCSAGNFQRAQRTKRQCLLGDIGKCAAPCVGWVTPEEHKEIAVKLDAFMEKGMENLLPTLRAEMATASEKEEFERAARLRDQIESFEKAQRSTQGNLSDDLRWRFHLAP